MDSKGGWPFDRAEPDRIRVLHVDDEPDFAALTAEFLERESERLTVATETDTGGALDRLAEERVDCIVSDYDMPGCDGIELLERVREREPEMPFILFTGQGSEEVAGEAISAGVTDYLKKGGTEKYTVLANRITNAVDGYRARRRVERGHRAIEAANEGIALVGEDGQLGYVNPAFAETFGYEQAALVGTDWAELFPDAQYRELRSSALPAAEEAGGWTGEVHARHRDGSELAVEQTLVRTADGTLICTVLDRSEQRERRRQLTASRDRLATLTENLPIVLFTLDEAGRFTRSEGRALSKLGVEPGELVGESVFEAYEGHPEILADCRAALDGERVHSVIDVEQRVFEVWYEPLPEGEDAVVGVAIDVTERRKRERRIEGLHEATRSFMQASSHEEVAAAAVETAERYLEMPLGSVFLREGEELAPAVATETVSEVIGDLPRLPLAESIAGEVFESGEGRVLEDVSEHPDRYNPETPVRGQIILPLGEHGVLHLSSTESGAFTESDVTLARILAGTTTEALGRVDREAALRETNRQLQAVLDTVDARIFTKNTDGEYQLINDTALSMYDIDDREAVLGETASALFPEPIAEEIAAYDREVLETGETIRREERLPGPDGERTHLTVKSPIRDDDGTVVGLCAVSTDITERTERERELEDLRRRMELALSGTSSVVWERDLVDGSFTRHGPIEQLYGDVDGGLGETIEEFYGMIHPEDRDAVRAAMERAIEERGSYRTEYRVEGGSGIRWFQTRGEVHTEGDEPTRMVGLATEITEQKRRERELERQNERLDEFASIVSHDLRNPLTVAKMRLDLVAEECNSDHIDDIEAAHDRMRTLIDDLLMLARESDQVTDAEPVDLDRVARECWGTVETGQTRLRTDLDRRIEADRSRVRQLLENLIRNAVEHGSTSPDSQARQDAVDGDSGGVESDDGGGVTVTVGQLDGGFYVADDGVGIDGADRERIFESGYSTVESGTGFGLAIVRKVVDAHGWEIDVTESAEGGARFEITGVEEVADAGVGGTD